MSADYAPLRLLGTLPYPSLDAHGQLLPRPKRLRLGTEDVERLRRLVAQFQMTPGHCPA
ncbi:hypothetical protein H4Q26_006711 [Puccinia striiformis f. sp. tritici PST-130]|nr:hypothetical protein H4Q26_006711 [Puccinia striiformis f. sp. tritici PST-130]